MLKVTQCVRRLSGIISFINNSKQLYRYYCFLLHWSHGINMAVILLYDYILFMMENSKRNNINRPKELSIKIDNCTRKEKNIVLAFTFHMMYYDCSV
jgi:hypothetical protein